MTARKKLRAIMAGKKLVLMPGAYDALSARVIEAEGFEAIVAGGYAGSAACWRRPTWASPTCATMRAITAASATPWKSRSMSMPTPASAASTTCGRWCAPSRRPASPGCSSAIRCSRTVAAICRQADRAGRADAGQAQGRARRAARSATCSSPPAPTRRASRASTRRSGAASCSWRPAPTWRSRWASTPSRKSSGRCAKSPGRTWRRCRRRPGRRREASRNWKPPASAPPRSRRSRCSRRRTRCATWCACSSASDSLGALPGASHSARRLLQSRRSQGSAGARGKLRQGCCGAGAEARG